MFLNPWYANPSNACPDSQNDPDSSEFGAVRHCSSASSGGEPDRLTQLKPLKPGWTVHKTPEGRLYYCNHVTQTSGWLPPAESWDSGETLNLPYGWEAAYDENNKPYFINHINKTTTYEDPRNWGISDSDIIPDFREVKLCRDPDMGFGFVAGSEKPVIVRFITGEGPSDGKLLPGDQILSIDGQDVKEAPRDVVIQLVRNCKEKVTLVVCQPPQDPTSSRKSAMLSAAKRAKLKTYPCRVRFAESVDINESTNQSAILPNVLKVFLENGQTKSFKYDTSTSVKDVIDSLKSKLGLQSSRHFSLVVEHVKSLRRNKLTILDPQENLSRIASRPGAHNLRCLFRVTFAPLDIYEFLREDSVAFEYHFIQCANDVVNDRFAPELKHETSLRLAALHIHQHTLAVNGLVSDSAGPKAIVKAIEKECGLERFLPTSLLESMKRKEVRKFLSHFLKLNNNSGGDQTTLSSLQTKLHYLKIISELPSYGAKCFSTHYNVNSNIETVILISPKFGVSQITSLQESVPVKLCDFIQISDVFVSKQDSISKKLDIRLKQSDQNEISICLEDRDSIEFIIVISGYFKLITNEDLPILYERGALVDNHIAPPYCSLHSVHSQGWNYPIQETEGQQEKQHKVNLGIHPAYHSPVPGFKLPNSQFPSMFGSDSGSSSDADSSMTTTTSNTDVGSSSVDEAIRKMASHSDSKSVNEYRSTIKLDIKNKYAENRDKKMITKSNEKNKKLAPNGILKKPPRVLPVKSMAMSKSPQDLMHDGNIENVIQIDELVRRVSSTKDGIYDEVPSSTLPIDLDANKNYETGRFHLQQIDSLKLLKHKEDEEENSSISSNTTEHTNSPRISRHSYPSRNLVQSSALIINRLKQSDSSFGLHSPDNLGPETPMTLPRVNNRDNQRQSSMDKQIKPGKLLISDSDIIDLTMIPPPMTPDEDGIYRTIGTGISVENPPTPFADKQTLEAELIAIEKDLVELESIKTWEKLRISDINPNCTVRRDCSSNVSVTRNKDSLDNVDSVRPSDIDSFIASATVPPPPPPSRNNHDISSFIVTPPPPTGPDRAFSGEKEVLEMKVVSNVVINCDKISPKIASLQQRLVSLTSPEGHKEFTDYGEKTTKPTLKDISDTLMRKELPFIPQKFSKKEKVLNVSPRQMSPPSNPPPPPPPPRVSTSSLIFMSGSKLNNDKWHSSQVPLLTYQFGCNNLSDSSSESSTATSCCSETKFNSSDSGEEYRSLPLSCHGTTGPPKLPPKISLPTHNNVNQNGKLKPKLPLKNTVTPSGPKYNGNEKLFSNPHPANSKPCHMDITSTIASNSTSNKDNDNDTESNNSENKVPGLTTFNESLRLLSDYIKHIEESSHMCAEESTSQESSSVQPSVEYQEDKESLTRASRLLITASKDFVKSATESDENACLKNKCLSECMTHIKRIYLLARNMALHTNTPAATYSLIIKVKDVLQAYVETVKAAALISSSDSINVDSDLQTLMSRATKLAGVLTLLMRSLKVF